jgi:hypothetical protein
VALNEPLKTNVVDQMIWTLFELFLEDEFGGGFDELDVFDGEVFDLFELETKSGGG